MGLFAGFDGLHALAGLLVGLLVGLTGVGGGSLMTPLLVLLFGVAPQTAVGTDLLFAAVTKIAGSAVHGRRQTVDWRIVGRLALGSVPAAALTLVWLSGKGQIGGQAQQVILIALAVLLLITALSVVLRARIAIWLGGADRTLSAGAEWAGTVATGALLGLAVTISSVGAGAIGVTALLMLYPRLPLVRIVGSDIAHAVPLVLVAGFGHWWIGDVDLQLLLNLVIGSLPGVVVGSLLATGAPDRVLRLVLAAVLSLSSWQLFAKAATPAKTPPAAHHP